MAVKKLSVITVSYNNREGLLNTINSVINQTYRNFEFIIVDGGSSDGSLELLKQYDQKIDLWVSEKDKGVYHAMNKGVSMASGEYCNFMNSGDTFFNEFVLEKIFPAKPESDIFIGRAKTPYRVIEPPGNPTLSYFYNRQPINHQAAFIKKHLLLTFPYDETSIRIVSDWKFFLQAFIIGNCSYHAVNEWIVNFNAEGMGSQNLDLNLAEQEQVINTIIYPRILEDYQIIRYKDSALMRIFLQLAKFTGRYGKYMDPSRYFRKIKKTLSP